MYSRSRGVSRRTRARNSTLVGAHRHLGRLAVLDADDREPLAAGQAERLGGLAAQELQRQDRPSSAGSSGGSARTTRRSRPSRRAGSAPSPPSRATSPSRTPCRRARPAAFPRPGSAPTRRRSSSPRRDGTCTVHVPSEPGTSWLRRRTLANVPRTITSWLPRRAPYELKSAALDAVLDEVRAGRRVGLDRAGGRDVVGRHRVAEPDEDSARPRRRGRCRARAPSPRSTAAGARRSSRAPTRKSSPSGAGSDAPGRRRR